MKWVRSDNHEPPFARAATPSNKALEVLRRCGDKHDLIDALGAASVSQEPAKGAAMLEEAMSLAVDLGDDEARASVLARMSSRMAFTDRAQAVRLSREALEVYRRLGNVRGQAQCLFSLAIQEDSPELKKEAALESAALNRSLGKYADAARAMSLAVMYGEELQGLVAQEELLLQGLADAQASNTMSLESHCYAQLAKVAVLKGDTEAAERYQRWHNELESADGLTPRQRKNNDRRMMKDVLQLARKTKNNQAIELFKEMIAKTRKPDA